jgi:hypothetical protein
MVGRQLREFNAALLGKWCWRMLVDKTGLWYRMLEARYMVEVGRVAEGGGRGSPWWREIVRIHDGVREAAERGWFEDRVVRRVGNGMETLFWSDPWQGESRWVRGFNDCLICPFTGLVRLQRCGIYGGEREVGRGCGGVP